MITTVLYKDKNDKKAKSALATLTVVEYVKYETASSFDIVVTKRGAKKEAVSLRVPLVHIDDTLREQGLKIEPMTKADYDLEELTRQILDLKNLSRRNCDVTED